MFHGQPTNHCIMSFHVLRSSTYYLRSSFLLTLKLDLVYLTIQEDPSTTMNTIQPMRLVSHVLQTTQNRCLPTRKSLGLDQSSSSTLILFSLKTLSSSVQQPSLSTLQTLASQNTNRVLAPASLKLFMGCK